MANATPEEIITNDRRFFGDLDEVEDIEVIGLDVAENAVAYAERAGLLDEGLTINLENESLPEAAKEELAAVDLVTSTGCIGYVTEKSFNQLLPAVSRGRQPWFANFVLRMFPFDSIEEILTKAGYVTEKLEGQTFVQRKFTSVEEHAQVLQQLQERGINPTDKETEGELLAEFYLSRPKADALEFSIDQLMPA